jgi:hypothetical protein
VALARRFEHLFHFFVRNILTDGRAVFVSGLLVVEKIRQRGKLFSGNLCHSNTLLNVYEKILRIRRIKYTSFFVFCFKNYSEKTFCELIGRGWNAFIHGYFGKKPRRVFTLVFFEKSAALPQSAYLPRYG